MKCQLQSAIRGARRIYHLLHGDKILRAIGDYKASRVVPFVMQNYCQGLSRIRLKANNNEKIRILFLISDASKWKMQTVFDAMAKSERFDPLVAVSQFGWHESRSAAEATGRQTMQFFKGRGMPVVNACSDELHRAAPLEAFSPDIVFYGQPWDVEPAHDPVAVSRYALTCYVPYYVPNFAPQNFDYAMPFHRTIFRYFLMNETCIKIYRDAMGALTSAGEMVAVGHPMLDCFSEGDFAGNDNCGVVIYAPHWSFPHKDNPNAANISTFLWTGRAMLDYAKSHSEIKWAFKPHPVLRGALIKSGVMSKGEVDDYYSAWDAVGESCYDGNYVDLFKRSRMLVTDCASFLTEYACTGKPIVRLVSPVAISQPGELNGELYSTYYQVHTPEELEPMLDKIVVRREDPNREARLSAAKAMNLTGVDAAGNIVTHLKNLIWGSGRNEEEN